MGLIMITGLTPDYDISTGGASILARLDGRAASITITDSAGTDSDTLQVDIEAGDKAVALPRKGAELSVSMGYKETGLSFMGRYTVDEVRVSGPPIMLSISAKAADMRASLKEHRTQAYSDKTLGAIISEIAGRHGLKGAVSGDLYSRKIPYLGQTEESDLHLISRLARLHGAVAAPKNGKLVFTKKGAGQSASGQALTTITLTPDQCSDFDIQMPDRPQVKEVQAHWHDRKKAERKTEKAAAGGTESGFTLRHDFPSQDEAQWAGEAKADDLKRAGGSFSASLVGTPGLVAEGIVKTSGFYPGCDATWSIKTATHTIDGSSFTTKIDCELKA
jgi:uncharacterized protein